MRMEQTESSETSAINVTWTPGTYPKDNKIQLRMEFSLSKSASQVLWYWRTIFIAEWMLSIKTYTRTSQHSTAVFRWMLGTYIRTRKVSILPHSFKWINLSSSFSSGLALSLHRTWVGFQYNISFETPTHTCRDREMLLLNRRLPPLPTLFPVQCPWNKPHPVCRIYNSQGTASLKKVYGFLQYSLREFRQEYCHMQETICQYSE